MEHLTAGIGARKRTIATFVLFDDVMSRMGVNDRGGGKKRRNFLLCQWRRSVGKVGGTNRIGCEFLNSIRRALALRNGHIIPLLAVPYLDYTPHFTIQEVKTAKGYTHVLMARGSELRA